MLKEKHSFLKKLMMLVDIAFVPISFIAAYYVCLGVHREFPDIGLKNLYALHQYLWLIPLVMFLWAGSLYILDEYKAFRGKSVRAVLLDVFKAGFLVTLFFGWIAFILQWEYISRFYMTLVFFITGGLIAAERIALVILLGYLRKKGFNFRYALIVGTGSRAIRLIELFQKHPEWGYRVAGIIDDEPERVGMQILGCPVIGMLRDMPKILTENVIDEIFFVVPRSWLGRIEDAVKYCEILGKRVNVAVDHFNLKIAKARQTDFSGFPFLVVETTPSPDKVWQLYLKRFLDLSISGLALIVLAPFFLILAGLIKTTSKGPVFFKQTRTGLNGRKFTLFKFRTMAIDAEARLAELQKYNQMTGPAFKMENDPRITPLGKWMRKYSLDELPQLFNILAGDMSIVGPRPPIPLEVKEYENWHRRRLSMPPGLTCLWQVQGRNEIVRFDEWMRLDLEYIDNWSLWLDLQIFARTIPTVILARGAK